MNRREQREFISKLPPEVAKKSKLVIYLASIWPQIEEQGPIAYQRLMADLRARVMEAE